MTLIPCDAITLSAGGHEHGTWAFDRVGSTEGNPPGDAYLNVHLLGGNDVVGWGPGNDQLYGDAGDDTLYGGAKPNNSHYKVAQLAMV